MSCLSKTVIIGGTMVDKCRWKAWNLSRLSTPNWLLSVHPTNAKSTTCPLREETIFFYKLCAGCRVWRRVSVDFTTAASSQPASDPPPSMLICHPITTTVAYRPGARSHPSQSRCSLVDYTVAPMSLVSHGVSSSCSRCGTPQRLQ